MTKPISFGNYVLLRQMVGGGRVSHLPHVPSQLVDRGLADLVDGVLIPTAAGRKYLADHKPPERPGHVD